jgi:thiol-disulfide isomerase/thioredoxin
MKMRVLTTSLVLMIAGSAFAQQEPGKIEKKADPKATQPEEKKKEEKKVLSVGDKAPALTIEKWIKGEPVTGFEKGKVYVVEFWATWCGPCIASMPHISELQKKYKDKGLTVIGTNIWEDQKYNDETLQKVKDFVAEQGDKMAYTVAYDGAAKAMDKNWMGAAGRTGIPSAFIVNQDGVIAFVGHPMKMDEPLEKIIAGKYDLKEAAEAARKEAEEATKVRELQGDYRKVGSLMQSGKHDEALAAIDKLMGKSASLDPQLAVNKYSILLNGKKDYEKAYAYAEEIADKYFKDDAMGLNNLAWQIVDPEGEVKNPNLALALRLSERAVAKDPGWANLDTLARVHFLKGDLAKAIDNQKKAVESVKKESGVPEQFIDELETRLKEYEKAAKDKK